LNWQAVLQAASSPASGGSTLADMLRIEGEDEVVDPEIAFTMDPASLNNGVATFRWNVLDGHYLYKKRMSFELVSPANASIGAAKMSEGVWEEDAFFGNSEVYRGSAVVELPVSLIANQPEALVRVGYQGCADIGICYPPTYKDVKLVEVMAAAAGATTAGTGSVPTMLHHYRKQSRIDLQTVLNTVIAGW